MQVPRELSYEDLQKLMLKEMAPILHDDILTSSQPQGVSTNKIFLQRIFLCKNFFRFNKNCSL